MTGKAQASFFKCPINFREWFKIIMRGWSQHLTPKELAFVLFVFDRTFAWGKEWEIIRYSDMVGGRHGKDGRILAGVAASSTASAMRLCKQLKDKGVLVTKRLRVGQMMSLNYEWKPSANDCRTNQPKNMKTPRRDIAKTIDHDVAKTIPLYKYPSGKRNAPQNKTSAGAEGTSLEATILASLERSAQRRQAKTSKQTSLRVEAIRKTMEDGCIAGKVKPFLLTAAEAGALVSLGRRSGLSVPDFLDRLKWTASNWPMIIATEFGWMTDPPAYPAPLFIVKQWNKIMVAWEDRDNLERKASASDTERHTINLQRTGMNAMLARRVARRVKDKHAEESADEIIPTTNNKKGQFNSW